MAQTMGGPSRIGYVIAAVVFLLGCVIAAGLAGWFIYSMFSMVSGFQRVVVPGSVQIQLSDTGAHGIYYEYESEVGGRTFRTGESLPQLDVELIEAATGQPVPLREPLAETTYDIQGRAGISYLVFDIDRPGAYQIRADYPPGADGPDVVLAVGPGVGSSIALGVGALFGSIGIFCGTTLLVAVIVAVTFWRRRARPAAPHTTYPTS